MTKKLSPNEQYIENQKIPWNAINDRYRALDFDIRRMEAEIKATERDLVVLRVTRDTLYKWLKEQPFDNTTSASTGVAE